MTMRDNLVNAGTFLFFVILWAGILVSMASED